MKQVEPIPEKTVIHEAEENLRGGGRNLSIVKDTRKHTYMKQKPYYDKEKHILKLKLDFWS